MFVAIYCSPAVNKGLFLERKHLEPRALFLKTLCCWYKENDPVYFTSCYIPVTRQTGLGSVAVVTLVLFSFPFANFTASFTLFH